MPKLSPGITAEYDVVWLSFSLEYHYESTKKKKTCLLKNNIHTEKYSLLMDFYALSTFQ